MKILVAGEGGQGVQAIGEILAIAGENAGYNTTYIPNFGVEQRGGVSLAFTIIQKHKIGFPKFAKADFLALLAARATPRIKQYLDPKTEILDGVNLIREPEKHQLSSRTYNMFILGMIVDKMAHLPNQAVLKAIEERLGPKSGLADNLKAFKIGLGVGLPTVNLLPEKKAKSLTDKDSQKKFTRFPHLCKGCGLCLTVCPQKALSFSKKELGLYKTPMPKVDLSKCTACKTCEQICPDCAILVEKTSPASRQKK